MPIETRNVGVPKRPAFGGHFRRLACAGVQFQLGLVWDLGDGLVEIAKRLVLRKIMQDLKPSN